MHYEPESLNKRKAYLNGTIYTVNPKQPFAEVVVTEGSQIVFVGNKYDAKLFSVDKIIDLKGRLMLPGFIDNHVHFINGGFHLLGLNLHGTKSINEFQSNLKSYVEKNKGKWITGGNWDHESWDEKKLPSREMIDGFSQDTPIFIIRLDAHMGLANSLALELAGIDKDTPNPAGGIIEKDEEGIPTGILKDNAMELVYRIIPNRSENDFNNALNAALDEARRNGFTSAQDITRKEEISIYKKFDEENKLTCRIFSRFPISNSFEYIKDGIKVGWGNEKLRFGSLKAFTDGSLGAGTAFFFDPYCDNPASYGMAMDIVTDGRLEAWGLEADKNNLQLSIHAIGDKANSLMLDLFEKIINNNPFWDRRLRIEHAQHLRKKDIKRFAELGVIASVQPLHLVDDGNWAEKKIGRERASCAYPFKTMLDNNVIICFGSDFPIASLNALKGIHAAVTRQTTDGKNPDGWIPEEKISVEDAVKCYTINNAYASFEENIKGSIEPGKLADFVILAENIFLINPDEIKDVEVISTIFDGEEIYNRGER